MVNNQENGQQSPQKTGTDECQTAETIKVEVRTPVQNCPSARPSMAGNYQPKGYRLMGDGRQW